MKLLQSLDPSLKFRKDHFPDNAQFLPVARKICLSDADSEIGFDFQDFTILLDFFLANSDMQLKTYRFYKTLY